ncbi:probable glutamate receptor [Athalia rosae]|uniref:probable glutamate receptor n=1 Tax=Athalia rosae TaxID=37344 RepID=UPI002034665B|nr:probable glutamate receptor [Athalia rosae]
MRLFLCCTMFALFAIGIFGPTESRQLGKLIENDNLNTLKCLDTIIGTIDWVIDDLIVISNDMDVLKGHMFERVSNYVWKVYSIRNEIKLVEYSNGIIFSDDFDSLNETLDVINIKQMDPRGKYIIVMRRYFVDVTEIREASLGFPAKMWGLDKVNIIFLLPRKEDVLVMTYFPFVNNCQLGELEILDVWKNNYGFVKGVELFPAKMLDAKGCVQNISQILANDTRFESHWEQTESGNLKMGGVGGKLISLIADKLNVTLNILVKPSLDWPAYIDQVIRGETFCAVAGVFPLSAYLEDLTLETGYLQVSYGLGYKVRNFDISWLSLMCPLSKLVRIFMACTFLTYLGLLWLSNSPYTRESHALNKLKILDIFGVLVASSRVMPTGLFGRYLFGMWILFSYLMSVAYTSGLVSFLTTPNEKEPITTFEELLADGMKFGGSIDHRNFYYDPSDPVMMKIYENFKIIPTEESQRILDDKEGATGVFSSNVKIHNALNIDNASNQIRMLEERAFTFPVPLALRRGMPFSLGIQRYASRAVQSGLVDYWVNFYSPTARIVGTRSKRPSVLTTRHIRGLLYIHFTGLILSGVIFLGEIYFHKQFIE